MPSLRDVSIKISNYKCIGPAEQGYDTILPINLIIGRNNAGKSTLLDLIGYMVEPTDLRLLGHKGQLPKVVASDVLDEVALGNVFPKNRTSDVVGGSYWEFGKQWIGKRLTWEIGLRECKFTAIDPPFPTRLDSQYSDGLAKGRQGRFSGYSFKRLMANRDITPEGDMGQVSQIQPTGQAATNAIQNYINKVARPSRLVEVTLLAELNKIFEPDSRFTRLLVQQIDSGPWELHVEEAGKGRVALSHTGSGLKTIILVLVFLVVVPDFENKPLSNYLFGFEELENNLHPALQRRLLLYLRKTAVEKGCHFFLTTHSNVAIDLFAGDDQAQLIHVTHDGTAATAKRIRTYIDNRSVIEDLGFRASDLLQANGIIWVEGPSDRAYIARWIELWSEGELREGSHFQCVFYGGKLLSHLSAEDPTIEPQAAVNILTINRNTILVFDSDREDSSDKINATKERVCSEVEGMGGITWVTAGRTIENYIPEVVLKRVLDVADFRPCGQYEDFASYIDSMRGESGNRFLRTKVAFAQKAVSHMDKESLRSSLDLEKKLTDLCELIRKWNDL
jgi:hypothetical protein